MSELGPAANLIDLDSSAAEIFEHFYDLGWTDGLPIIPPTPDLVDEMLKYTDRDRYGGVSTRIFTCDHNGYRSN